MTDANQITQLLVRVGEGDQQALDAVVPLVYEDLRMIARRYLGHRDGAVTLDTVGLVHEAYLKVADQTHPHWNNRDHFLAVCSIVMRNLVVDLARARAASKRGGDHERVTFEENMSRIDAQAEEILAVDEALERLALIDPRMSRIVECRFFAGYTEAETARVLDLGERTVRRLWVRAKALLMEMLRPEGP